MNISICISTKNRKEGLKKLLESINNLNITPEMDVDIVVVENDQVNFSETVIQEYAAAGRFKINYFLEPQKGLVFARNRSIKEAGTKDYYCFTDDDETLSKNWLLELVKCQQEFVADVVAGPTFPVFTRNLPEYIEGFHQPETYPYGTEVETAYTGSLLITGACLRLIKGPFDTRFNATGGEDIYLTGLITKNGGVIRFNPEAKAYETLPDKRSTVKYIIQRTFRNSNTGIFVRSLLYDRNYKWKILPRLILRFCKGLIIIIPLLIFGHKNKLQGLIKIVNAIGGFYYIIGGRNRFYTKN